MKGSQVLLCMCSVGTYRRFRRKIEWKTNSGGMVECVSSQRTHKNGGSEGISTLCQIFEL